MAVSAADAASIIETLAIPILSLWFLFVESVFRFYPPPSKIGYLIGIITLVPILLIVSIQFRLSHLIGPIPVDIPAIIYLTYR